MATKKISKKTNNYSRLNKKLNVKKRLTKLRGGARNNVGSIIGLPSDSYPNNSRRRSFSTKMPNLFPKRTAKVSPMTHQTNIYNNKNLPPLVPHAWANTTPPEQTPITQIKPSKINNKIKQVEAYLQYIVDTKNENAKNKNYENLHKYLMELIYFKSVVNTTNNRSLKEKQISVNNTKKKMNYFTRVNKFIANLPKTEDEKSIISYIDCKILLLYIITLFHDSSKNTNMIDSKFLIECKDLIDYTPSDTINNQKFMINAMTFICNAVKRFTFTGKICPEFNYSEFKINIDNMDIINYLKTNQILYSLLFGISDSDIEKFKIIAYNISTYLNPYGTVTDSYQFGMNPFDPTIDFSKLPPRIQFMRQSNNNNNNYELYN